MKESELNTSEKEIKVERPEPITSEIEVVQYKRRMDPQIAIEALLDGYYVLIDDYISSGITILSELKKYLKNNKSDKSYQEQHDTRSEFRDLSHKLLLEVRNNKLVVKKAPEIGWFKILYSDLNEFLLPFPQVQGLNSSWQWYEKGISIPVLHRKIHPWFGTYFPTRFEHIELFDNWLKSYRGEKKSAIDIGIGSGILSFQMMKHGFEKVYGTDSNPNAIVGLKEDLKLNNLQSKMELFHGDLFANCVEKSELIVFNPPWIPAFHNTDGIDKAIYYEPNLFPRFFSEAKKHLVENGRIVLLFSNLAQVTKTGEANPIEVELSKRNQFKKEFLIQKKVAPASKKTRRDQSWRSSEMVELWVLKQDI